MPEACRTLSVVLCASLLVSACSAGREQVRTTDAPAVALSEEERRLQDERAAIIDQVREELAGAREEVSDARKEQETRAERFAESLPASPIWSFTGTVTAAGPRLILEDGKGNRRELTVDPRTTVAVSGTAASSGERGPVQEGAQVRATYVLDGGELVARHLEIVRSANGR